MIGIGCDIVKLDRVASLMERSGHERILTKQERSLCQDFHDHRLVEWVAGRFAAKEAIIKAFASEKKLLLSEVEILYEGKRPVCHMEGYLVHISIAHEDAYAIAYAMIERKEE